MHPPTAVIQGCNILGRMATPPPLPGGPEKTSTQCRQQDQEPHLQLISKLQIVLLHTRQLLHGAAMLPLFNGKLFAQGMVSSHVLAVTPDVCNLPDIGLVQQGL